MGNTFKKPSLFIQRKLEGKTTEDKEVLGATEAFQDISNQMFGGGGGGGGGFDLCGRRSMTSGKMVSEYDIRQ